MDVLMVVLRIIHIFAGIIWVGSTLFMVAFLTPTLQQLGPDAGKFMRTFMLQSRYARVIPAVAILNTLSGLLMVGNASGGFDSAFFSSPHGIVLSIGVLFGLFAFGHGMGVILPLVKRMQRVMGSMSTPPAQEQLAELQALQIKMGKNTRIITILMVVAVLGMASFRYFG